MIVFDKLFEILKKRGISQYKLITKYNISRNQIYRLRHNESVSCHTLNRILNILQDCTLDDIATFVKDEEWIFNLFFFIKSFCRICFVFCFTLHIFLRKINIYFKQIWFSIDSYMFLPYFFHHFIYIKIFYIYNHIYFWPCIITILFFDTPSNLKLSKGFFPIVFV